MDTWADQRQKEAHLLHFGLHLLIDSSSESSRLMGLFLSRGVYGASI